MKRVSSMLRSHRLLTLAAVAVFVAAGSAAAYTGASFNYKTANPSNIFTAGILSHSNDKSGSAVVSLPSGYLLPGQSKYGDVTIKNTGNVNGTFSVNASAVSGALAPAVNVSIDDITGGVPGTSVYTGTLAGLSNKTLGTWTPNETHTYRVTVLFVDHGTPADNTSDDNAYQNASLTFRLDWTSVQ